MAKSFEETDVWKKARELVNSIYHVTKSKEFSKDFGLTDQIRRAAVSVMSNIAEGFRERLKYRIYTISLYCERFCR